MGFINEFKQFISRGNMLDLAVGVVIGTAFGNIVTSLVSDIFMPPLGLLVGNMEDLKHYKIALTDKASVNIGNFIQNIITFLIIAFAIFLLLKLINRFYKKEEAKAAAPVVTNEEKLLAEIRDILRNK